jgi:hypothetical protein
MPVDASIALQTQTPRLENPMALQGQMLSLKNLATQGQIQEQALMEQQRLRREQQLLADVYRSSVKPDGSPDHASIVQGMADRGLGHMIPGYRKTMLDADKDAAEIAAKKATTTASEWELNKKRLDARAGALQSLLSRPQVSHDDVIQSLTGLVQTGVITPEQGFQAVKALPSNPAALRDYLVEEGLKVLDAGKRFELTSPKYNERDVGGSIQVGTTNPLTGEFTLKQDVPKSVTPGDILQARTSTANNIRSVTEQARGNDLQFQTSNVVPIPTNDGIVRYNKQTGQSAPVMAPGGADQLQQLDSPRNIAAKQYSQTMSQIQMARDLLPGATGSKIGSMVDTTLGAAGIATAGAEAAGQLEVVGGWLASNVPRFEGPQSDRDTLTYRQMAAQVADATKPVSVRLKALDTLQELTETNAKRALKGKLPGTVPTTPTTPNAPMRTITPEDYRKLAPGSQYKDPQGNIRTKPLA